MTKTVANQLLRLILILAIPKRYSLIKSNHIKTVIKIVSAIIFLLNTCFITKGQTIEKTCKNIEKWLVPYKGIVETSVDDGTKKMIEFSTEIKNLSMDTSGVLKWEEIHDIGGKMCTVFSVNIKNVIITKAKKIPRCLFKCKDGSNFCFSDEPCDPNVVTVHEYSVYPFFTSKESLDKVYKALLHLQKLAAHNNNTTKEKKEPHVDSGTRNTYKVINGSHQHIDTDNPNTFKIANGDTINKADANGLDQGKWERLYADGTLKCHGVYKDGKKEGYWERKRPNGNWEYQMNFVNGYPHGLCKFFYENGNLQQEANYKKGQFDGNVKKYNEKGILVSDENYTIGILNGNCKYYYENGIIQRQGEYIKGEMNGTWIYYTNQGKPQVKATLNMGKTLTTETIKD